MEEPLLPKNPTLYLQNMNERVKLPDLKNALYQLFSNNGEVVEVHAKTNIRMRGQAFVIYQDEESAEATLKALRGYVFFGKPMRVNFSKKESDVIAKMRGTFEESDKAKGSRDALRSSKRSPLRPKRSRLTNS
jgi:U2 small nuclear ribonucleoprotein B''